MELEPRLEAAVAERNQMSTDNCGPATERIGPVLGPTITRVPASGVETRPKLSGLRDMDTFHRVLVEQGRALDVMAFFSTASVSVLSVPSLPLRFVLLSRKHLLKVIRISLSTSDCTMFI